MTEHHSIIIVGAGLSGLYLAWRLQQDNHDVMLLESRNRTGGRILSVEYNDICRFDMGPAWVWPHLQPRLQLLLTRLGLKVFKQFTAGDLLYEKSPSDIERYSQQSSHSQSYRIEGGSQNLIDALQSSIAASTIHLDTRVQSIHQQGLRIDAVRDGENYVYSADTIILALPPRIAQQYISFDPELANQIIESWRAIPTWMSGHSKVVFIYAQPFWREQNLSGEVFSHHGPLAEIYDGSPATEEYFALTSFVGLSAQQRMQLNQDELIAACMAQLLRLFGEQSQQVLDIRIKDWSQDKNTATAIDTTTPAHHPHYADDMPRVFWDNALILAGTEVAREHGGYLEGALESADEALSLLNI
jgi:monoamine oxidase